MRMNGELCKQKYKTITDSQSFSATDDNDIKYIRRWRHSVRLRNGTPKATLSAHRYKPNGWHVYTRWSMPPSARGCTAYLMYTTTLEPATRHGS